MINNFTNSKNIAVNRTKSARIIWALDFSYLSQRERVNRILFYPSRRQSRSVLFRALVCSLSCSVNAPDALLSFFHVSDFTRALISFFFTRSVNASDAFCCVHADDNRHRFFTRALIFVSSFDDIVCSLSLWVPVARLDGRAGARQIDVRMQRRRATMLRFLSSVSVCVCVLVACFPYWHKIDVE